MILKRIADLIYLPRDVYRRIRLRGLKRPRKWRPADDLRRPLVDALVIGWTLRPNVEYLGGLGRGHRKDVNDQVAQVAKELYATARKADRRLTLLLAELRLRLTLRMYSWPVLRRDNSDLECFWKARFDPIYTALEEGTKRIALLARPEKYEAVVKVLALQRPRLELPKTAEDRARARVQRMKSMLVKRSRSSRVVYKIRIADRLMREMEQAEAKVERALSEYAHWAVAQLPESEREQEMKEIQRLLP